jgi:RNA polymerase sigma-70 factor (ECF subfamily)
MSMSSTASFADLMARLKAGDQDAATEIFHQFAHRLIGLARSRLDRFLRQKIDPEDVMQSVFRSFFVRQAKGEFDLLNWDSLWSLLTVITLRKCGHRVDYFRADCRDVRRESPNRALPDDSVLSWQAIAREPTPSEAVQLTETLEHVLRDFNEREREIISLSLQGYSPEEIVPQVGRTERTIYRVLERLKRKLRRLQSES